MKMGRSKPVPITPSVLRWAISESGYEPDELADKSHIAPDRLQKWVDGEEHPTTTEFKKVVRTLRRPSAVFFLPAPPKRTRAPVEFRHPPDAERDELSPQELIGIREAVRFQRALNWMLRELEHPPTSLPKVRVDSDPEEQGADTRRRLGVAIRDQLGWVSVFEALRQWRSHLEQAGVFVLSLSLGKESCRGFSLWDDYAPMITINTAWNHQARVFTLFHEYAHLLSRTNSACVEGSEWKRRVDRHGHDTERWCEQVAAATLLPWDDVSEVLRHRFGWRPGQMITDLDVAGGLAGSFKVSLRAAVLRLISKQAAGWDLYRQIPKHSDRKERGSGGRGRSRVESKQDRFGAAAFEIFANGVREGIMSRADALDYLDIGDADFDVAFRAVEHD